MKKWKKYLTGILALALVVGMVALLPRIHGEEFDENEYTFSEEETLESEIDGADSKAESESEQDELPIVESDEPMESDEPLESETPIESEITPDGELDGEIEDAEDANMQPAKLTLVPRELTEDELDDFTELDIWWCECDYTITNAEGKTCRIIDEEPSGGNMDIDWLAFYCGFTLRKFSIQPSAYYAFTGNFGTETINIAWNSDTYVSFQGSGAESFVFTKDGISVQGTNMNCNIYRNVGETNYKTILHATNASRAVLLYDGDGGFNLWSDGAYSIEVYQNGRSGSSGTVATANAAANSVYHVQNAATDSPQFTRVDVAE